MFGLTLIPLLLTLAGASNDLLDYLPTDVYWQAKGVQPARDILVAELQADGGGDIQQLIQDLGSDEFNKREGASRRILAKGAAAIAPLKEAAKSHDPEIANRATVILEEIANRAPAQKIRRLMAIRTVGESKDKEALPHLQKLLDSKEPFVADYARRAIASIEGKPYKRELAPASPEDLWLLPAGCGVVGQVRATGGRTVSLEKLLANMPPFFGFQHQDMMQQVYANVLQTLEQVGNVRFDSATVGISSDFVDGAPKFIIIKARGQFDSKAANEALKRVDTPKNRNGVDVYEIDGGGRLAFLSDTRAVVISGPGDENLPIEELFTAIETGKGKLRNNAELTRLIEATDTQMPLWLVAKISEGYRQSPILAPFDSLVFSGRREGNLFNLEIRAQGTDAAKIKAALATVQQQIEAAKAGLKLAVMLPMAKAAADFLDTVKLEAQGNQALLKASLTDPGLFGGAILPPPANTPPANIPAARD